MEDRLPRALADVDDDPVVLQADLPRGVRDELEHPDRLVRRELHDLSKARHMTLWDDEQMRLGARVDVADGDETVGFRDVIPLSEELAEEAVVRQRGSPPPRRRRPSPRRAPPQM